jgi:hypothetical protein
MGGGVHCIEATRDRANSAAKISGFDTTAKARGAGGHPRRRGSSALRSAIPRWTSRAHRTASTTLLNSANIPSPVFLTTRPRCWAILGSTRERRWSWSWVCVPSSSRPVNRLYPATSAARMAVSRRSRSVDKAPSGMGGEQSTPLPARARCLSGKTASAMNHQFELGRAGIVLVSSVAPPAFCGMTTSWNHINRSRFPAPQRP